MKRKVLILGAGGQLGRELVAAAGPGVDCVALTHNALDVGDAEAVMRSLADLAPQAVINAAAYTAVDAAETDAATAYRVNAEGPAHLAMACRACGARLLHVSTDFVFDGGAAIPYAPDAAPAPLNVYGRSKLAGEQAVLREHPGSLIVRSSWVYSRFGSNFVRTMLRLMSEREALAVVADQVGAPTWARGLAVALWAAEARPDLQGIYHWCDAGQCSWYEFALAIEQEARALGLLVRPTAVRPIPGSEYPATAVRPRYSVLDTRSSQRDLALQARPWRTQLRSMLTELKETPDG